MFFNEDEGEGCGTGTKSERTGASDGADMLAAAAQVGMMVDAGCGLRGVSAGGVVVEATGR